VCLRGFTGAGFLSSELPRVSWNEVLHASPENCRSQPAGDGLQCAAFIQLTRVIVNDHRWQASSHKGTCPRWKTVGASLLAMDSSAPRSSRSHALSLTTIAGFANAYK